MNRREYLRASALAALASSRLPVSAAAPQEPEKSAGPRGPSQWPIGVFNRAWANWGLDETLKTVRAAGFSKFGLISAQKGELLIGDRATSNSLDALRTQIVDAGLELVITALRFQETDALPRLQDEIHRQLDNTARLGARYLMTFGVDRPANFAKFEKLMNAAAARAEAARMRLVIKPHGGITLGPNEILACLERVGHPNLSVWYDPGNILHYTGADPVEAYGPLAKRVTGLCAKDCAKRGGEVMMAFGEGRVNFASLLLTMATSGFDGPVMIEGIKIGKTPEETAANARFNRLALERRASKAVAP